MTETDTGTRRWRVALLVEDGFDDAEVAGITEILTRAGAIVTTVAPWAGRQFTGMRGAVITSDLAAGAAGAGTFDAIVVPGGFAPDRIRMRHAMVDLVRDAIDAGKPVGAICRGPQVLISANAVRGRTLTCWPSIAVDVTNAGGLYVDRPVAVDGALITARKAADLAPFGDALLRALAASAGSDRTPR